MSARGIPTASSPTQASGRVHSTTSLIRGEHGLTLIEVMFAVIVLTVGILALLTAFTGAERLTLTAERRTSLAHRAEREVERLETVSYANLAMGSAPVHSSEASNPDYYVNYAVAVKSEAAKCTEVEKGGCYAWDSAELAKEEPIVVGKGECKVSPGAECGEVSATPTAWTDGRLSGEIYVFVTWHTDGHCGAGCPTANDYKRITVLLTVKVPAGTHAVAPVAVSTLIANPNAAAAEGIGKNPLTTPGTTCGGKLCTNGLSSNAQSWFLHDSGAEEDEKAGGLLAPTESKTHPTVASTGTCTTSSPSGCPKPDLMSSTAPTATALYDYSTDQDSLGGTLTAPAGSTTWKCPGVESGGICHGGRALQRNAECNAGEAGGPKPTAENLSNEMWVSEPLSSATTLTGAGGLSIYTQTVGGLPASATLCIAIYEVPQSIADLVESPPTMIAYIRHSSSSWPTSLEELSFDFELEFLRTEHAIAEKHRIGLRLWTAGSSTGSITLAYDVAETSAEGPSYSAALQLNTT